MTEQTPWRIAIVSMVGPVTARLVPAIRALGHEPAGIVTARLPPRGVPDGMSVAELAPEGLDLLSARDKWSMEPLLRALAPDLTICWAFPWKLPQAALDVAPLGSINLHPAFLPRHRGPIPLAWALRDGDEHFGVSWHRMDAELDTGGILAQGTIPIEPDDTEISVIGPKLGTEALRLLPAVLERVAAGDPGETQDESAATWAGHFENDDYAQIDWTHPARKIHDQVRAWGLSFPRDGVAGPFAELGGQRVRVTRTSLQDPGGGAVRVECGDGPVWIVAHEPT